MRLMEEFENTCREFPAFRGAVVKARDMAPDPGTRAQLDHLLNSLDQTYADFQKTFPKATEAVQQQFAKAEAQAKDAQATLAEAKAELDGHKAAAAAAASARAAAMPPEVTEAFPAPLPPLAPLDLAAGLRLRDELLNRFGRRRAPGGPRTDREIWEDWESEGTA